MAAAALAHHLQSPPACTPVWSTDLSPTGPWQDIYSAAPDGSTDPAPDYLSLNAAIPRLAGHRSRDAFTFILSFTSSLTMGMNVVMP